LFPNFTYPSRWFRVPPNMSSSTPGGTRTPGWVPLIQILNVFRCRQVCCWILMHEGTNLPTFARLHRCNVTSHNSDITNNTTTWQRGIMKLSATSTWRNETCHPAYLDVTPLVSPLPSPTSYWNTLRIGICFRRGVRRLCHTKLRSRIPLSAMDVISPVAGLLSSSAYCKGQDRCTARSGHYAHCIARRFGVIYSEDMAHRTDVTILIFTAGQTSNWLRMFFSVNARMLGDTGHRQAPQHMRAVWPRPCT
jgi:hypothetical protein